MAISTPFTQDRRVLPLSAPLLLAIDWLCDVLGFVTAGMCQASQPHFRSSKAPATCDCSFSRPLHGQWVNNYWWGWQNRTDLGKSTHLYNETQGNTNASDRKLSSSGERRRHFFIYFFFLSKALVSLFPCVSSYRRVHFPRSVPLHDHLKTDRVTGRYIQS